MCKTLCENDCKLVVGKGIAIYDLLFRLLSKR